MLGLGAKSKATPRPLPVVTNQTATMDITPGVALHALVHTPQGFTPIAGEPPLWLQSTTEVALVGTVGGRTEVHGFSGQGYQKVRLVAADGGPGAPHGRIVALAASPDGMTLAIADGTPEHVDIVLRYVISNGGQTTIASFDGAFHAVTLHWVGPSTLAAALAAEPPSRSEAPQSAASPAPKGGLFLIDVQGAGNVSPVKVPCPLSPVAFSPDTRFVVGEGDPDAPPMIFDRQTGACRGLGLAGPIRVLGWARGDAALLYAATNTNARGPGVFRYILGSGTTELIAIASGAAAYTTSDTILALGNRGLNFQTAMATPNRSTIAQIATFDPARTRTQIQSLGIPTTPAMLTASTMIYSPAFSEVAMQLYAASSQGPIRQIATYSILDHKAFVLARGRLRGVAVIGFAPSANQLLIFDGDGIKGALAVITPSL
jgi:hypothetical protein